MAGKCVGEAEKKRWLPSLRRGRSDWEQMLETLGRLYVEGVSVDWKGFDRDYERRKVTLPTYPFQRERYWVETTQSHANVFGDDVSGEASHPLLGKRLNLPFSREIRFEARFRPSSPPYLDDHRLFGTVVTPAASHVAMLLCAAREAFGGGTCTLEQLLFPKALALSDQD